MANHDNYDMNLLKALENIAKSLKSIDSLLRDLILYQTSFGIIETEENENDTTRKNSFI